MSDLFPDDPRAVQAREEAMFRGAEEAFQASQDTGRPLFGGDVFAAPARGAAGAAFRLSELGATASYRAFDAVNEGFRLLTGQDSDPDDLMRRMEDDFSRSMLQYRSRLLPDPQRSSYAGEMLFGLSEIGATAMAGGPSGALRAALTGGGFGVSTAHELIDDGVDEQTAWTAGGIEGVSMAGLVAAPVAFPSRAQSLWARIAQRAGTGAALNAGLGMVYRGSMSGYLDAQGYEEQASRYNALDAQAILSDVILGAVFGGAFGPRHWRDIDPALASLDEIAEMRRPTRDQVDAAMTVRNDIHARVDTAPGVPLDLEAEARHADSLARAERQFAEGEEIDVGPWAEGDLDGFAPHPDDIEMMAAEIEYARDALNDEPRTLTDFVRRQGEIRDDKGRVVQRGGIRDDRGDVAGSAGDALRGFASLLSPTGRSLDDIALAAWEEGFFPGHAERPSVNELIDALDEEARGLATFTTDEAAAFAARNAREILNHYEGRGVDTSLTGQTLREALSPLARRADAMDAVREVLEAEGFPDLAREVEALRAQVREMGGDLGPDEMMFSRRARAEGGLSDINRRRARPAPETGTEADFLSRLPTQRERLTAEQYREIAALHPWFTDHGQPSPRRIDIVRLAVARHPDGRFVHSTDDILEAIGSTSVDSMRVLLSQARKAGIPIPTRTRGGQSGATGRAGGEHVHEILRLMEEAERNNRYISAGDIALRLGFGAKSADNAVNARVSQVLSGRGNVPDEIRERLRTVMRQRAARRGWDAKHHLYSLTDTGGFSSVEGLKARAAVEFGADWDALARAGRVEIVQASRDVPAGLMGLPRGVQAVHMRDAGVTYFIANNIRPQDLKGLVLHEIGVHHGMADMLGKGGFREVLRQIERMVEAEHPELVKARALAERFAARPEHVPEETLAYLIEANADLPIVNRILARIRQWLIKTFGTTFGMRLTVDDIRQLAVDSLRRVAEQARRESADVTPVAWREDAEAVMASASDRPAPPFYSAVARAVENSTTNRASGSQWLATIQKTPGVKKEELEWIGLPDFLKAQEGQIAREDVLSFVRSNGVRVEETVLGGESSLTAEQQQANLAATEEFDRLSRAQLNNSPDEVAAATNDPAVHAAYEKWKAADQHFADTLRRAPGGWEPDGTVTGGDLYEADGALANARGNLSQAVGARRAALSEIMRSFKRQMHSERTRWSQYQLPGGENYRELLLRLPTAQSQYNALLAEVAARHGRSDNPMGWGSYATPEERAQLERLAERGIGEADDNAAFRSSHWDAPNVLAHVRFNERVDSNGARTLFIEELQSDWLQAIRERGFQGEDTSGWTATREGDTWIVRDERGTKIDTTKLDNTPEEAVQAVALRRSLHNQPPNAPFKNNAWASLALKRMIRYASENGFDQIAWTRGQHQIERFNLATHVPKILVREGGEGAYHVRLPFQQQNGTALMRAVESETGARTEMQSVDEGAYLVMTREQMEQVFGKSLTETLMFRASNSAGGHLREVDTKGVEIGGSGMRAFYDRIMVNIANDLGKKYGARVGETEINTTHAIDIENMGDGEFVVTVFDRNKVINKETFASGEEAQAWADEQRAAANDAVHSLPITPEMRDAALEQGQMLFSRRDPNRPDAPQIGRGGMRIASARPFRQSLVGGSADLMEAARLAQEQYDKLSPAWQALMDNPEMLFSVSRERAFGRKPKRVNLPHPFVGAADVFTNPTRRDLADMLSAQRKRDVQSIRWGITPEGDLLVWDGTQAMHSMVAESAGSRFIRHGEIEDALEIDAVLSTAEKARTGELSEYDPRVVAQELGVSMETAERMLVRHGKIKARDVMEAIETEAETAREMGKGYDAAVRCAIRHGGSMGTRFIGARAGMGAGEAISTGHLWGMTAGIPVGWAASHLAAQNADPVGYRERMMAAREPAAMEAARNLGAMAGLDAPAELPPPKGVPLSDVLDPAGPEPDAPELDEGHAGFAPPDAEDVEP